MYHTIREFVQDWKVEAGLTLQVLEKLEDASLGQAVSEAQNRTLGDLGWHLVGSIPVFLGAGGVEFEGPDYKIPTPGSAAKITNDYRQMSEAAVKALEEQWTDEKLPEEILLFGMIPTTYAGLLNILVRHQIHHRGQMTILMRQAGLVPPGIYGPNEEETAAMRAAREQK